MNISRTNAAEREGDHCCDLLCKFQICLYIVLQIITCYILWPITVKRHTKGTL